MLGSLITVEGRVEMRHRAEVAQKSAMSSGEGLYNLNIRGVEYVRVVNKKSITKSPLGTLR